VQGPRAFQRGMIKLLDLTPPFSVHHSSRVSFPPATRPSAASSSRFTVSGKPSAPRIPVEREKNFECPPHLIEELIALLPKTSKALVIGWRGTEDRFLNLLKKHLKPGVRLHVVAGGLKDAEEAQVRICRALMNNRPTKATASDEGFTDFMLSGAAEKFLGASRTLGGCSHRLLPQCFGGSVKAFPEKPERAHGSSTPPSRDTALSVTVDQLYREGYPARVTETGSFGMCSSDAKKINPTFPERKGKNLRVRNETRREIGTSERCLPLSRSAVQAAEGNPW